MSRSREAYERLLDLVKSVVVRKNLLKPLSLHLGKHERYLTNLFSEKFSITVETLFEIAASCGLPVSWLLDRAAPQTPPLPESQMLFEYQGTLPDNAFLDEVVWRLAQLDRSMVQEQPGLICYRPLLESLEEERLLDRLAVLNKVEELTQRLLTELREKSGAVPSRRLGELAASLALWATIQRTQGHLGLAVKAFLSAFPLVRRSEYAWAQGICFQRASHLIRELDRPDLALAFINEAQCQFTIAEAWQEVWRVYVDRGTHYSTFPAFPESTAAYLVALEHLPASDWRYRAGAFQGLSTNAHRQKRLSEAREYLERGLQECRQPSLITAYLRWREAAILADLGQSRESLSAFQVSLNQMGHFASAADIALVCLDYAEALLRSNQIGHFKALVRDATQWLPALRSNASLHRVLAAFIDNVRLGDVSLEDIDAARRKVRVATQPKPSIQLPQPPTGTL